MSSPSAYLTSLFSLTSRTALVTGGSRGIGRGLALALANAGADIILLRRTPSSTASTEAAIRALGRDCSTVDCDLIDPLSVGRVVPTLRAQGRDVDILVNCAGWHRRKPAVAWTEDEVEGVWRVNFQAGFRLSRELAAVWIAEGEGVRGTVRGCKRIVNVASVLSFVGGSGLAGYAATKGAIAQATKALSNEWAAKGITVNAIAPGYIRTDLTQDLQDSAEYNRFVLERTPVGRWGVPEDLAGLVIYLASPASEFVTGAVHLVDGGFMAR